MTGVLDRVVAAIRDPSFVDLTARELRVLLVLLARAGRVGVAWPSVRTIAAETGIDRRDTRRTLRALEERGLITEQTGATGRSTRRYLVVPKATDGCFRDLAEGGDSPPAERDGQGGETPPATLVEGGESPRGESPRGRGDLPRRGGCFAPVAGGDSPRRTLRTQRTLARTGAREDLGEGEWADHCRNRDQILERLQHHGCGHRNPFAARSRIDDAIGEGLGVRDVDVLVRQAQRQATGAPAALVWHWLADVHLWRGVIADAELAARERRARRAPSERTTDRGPVRLAEAAGGGS